MMSLTNELTTVVKAAPMMMPMARSMTLPRIAKSRNSLSMASPHVCCFAADSLGGFPDESQVF